MQNAKMQQTSQGPVDDIALPNAAYAAARRIRRRSLMFHHQEICLQGAPVEVSNQGADVAGRVLLGALPLALPDVIYVPPKPLRP